MDYLEGNEKLKPFYSFSPDMKGIKAAIEQKEKQALDREVLVKVLREQYGDLELTDAVKKNLEALSSPKTFTITTAHQPNLFTGPLYFIYKICHAIRIAENLSREWAEYNFVPVFYLGSEDNDLEELNHTFVEGKRLTWSRAPGGAVGRMQVDTSLVELTAELESQLAVHPFGTEVSEMIRSCYRLGVTIQQATMEMVNHLFGKYGLVVLIADHTLLKAQMDKVFSDDLFHHIPSQIVRKTSASLGDHYEAQAYVRDINLFYLKDDIRERIEKKGEKYSIINTQFSFGIDEMKKELQQHPERFSPNVVLRGLYQCNILPDVAFVGGGGELAYWLQLKDLFDHYGIVFPVLVLRNSFLLIEDKWNQRIKKLHLDVTDLFQPAEKIMNSIVSKRSGHNISLNGKFEKAEELFRQLSGQASEIDPSLTQHVEAIKTKALHALHELEKKMLRAEKRKFSEQQLQMEKLKSALFPGNGLQERVENFTSFYAKWGSSFLDELYKNSLALEQEFVVLIESA